MKRWTLTLEEFETEDDATGRKLITFRPRLTAALTARGELTFAIYRMWEDEPETHEPARAAAMANARDVISRILEEIETPAVN